MKLLLISNSANAGEAYLEYPKEEIRSFLGEKLVKALFFPYAGVTISYDNYASKVRSKFNEMGHDLISIHQCENPIEAVRNAEAIVVGGGNTFQLIHKMYENGLVDEIRAKVLSGTPYIGWSAGSNLACPTIRTTNDMPVVEPKSFDAFNLIPFQINPHYLDANPEGHAGETREMRILEFLALNQDVSVVGLREGTMLKYENNTLHLIGPKKARIFRFGFETREVGAGDDLSFLFGSGI